MNYKDKSIFGFFDWKGRFYLNDEYSYITIRIYFYLLIAYFRGYVEVKEKYKNFDVLLKSNLMKHESFEYDVITDSRPGFLSIMRERKPQEKVTFYITTEGKKQFIKTNWKIFLIVCGFIGFVFGLIQFIISYFL